MPSRSLLKDRCQNLAPSWFSIEWAAFQRQPHTTDRRCQLATYRANVGDVEMISLTDGQGEGRATDVFPASDLAIWRSEYPELLDGEMILSLIHISEPTRPY